MVRTARRSVRANGDVIDYAAVLKDHPWLIERGRKCVLSCDSDGFLCGLLISNVLGWKVVGFYDNKVLALKRGVAYTDCTFLDIEINRIGVSSIGNHLVEFNRDITVTNHNFVHCVQPNMMRKFDGKNDFQRKYPFATVHLLLGLLQEAKLISALPKEALTPLLFTDGVLNNLFGYPENCLDWMRYLKIDQPAHILHPFLCGNESGFYPVMQELTRFFAMRDRFNASGRYNGTTYVDGGRNKRSGHKLFLSDTNGVLQNLVKTGEAYDIHEKESARVSGFIAEMGRLVGWTYDPAAWQWNDLTITILKKGILSNLKVGATRLNNGTYSALFAKNPFSIAMTAGSDIEYTLE